MSRMFCVLFGVALALVAVALPFVGLERHEGDVTPVLVGFVVLAVAIGCFVCTYRPAALEHYVRSAALVFLLLMLVSAVGLLSEQGAGMSGAVVTPFPFGTAGLPLGPTLD